MKSVRARVVTAANYGNPAVRLVAADEGMSLGVRLSEAGFKPDDEVLVVLRSELEALQARAGAVGQTFDFNDLFSFTCPCGKAVSIGHTRGLPLDSEPSALHDLPICREFDQLESEDYFEWARANGAKIPPAPRPS